MNQANLYFSDSIDLNYHGTVTLLGISSAGTVYVEELYDEDTWLARYQLSPQGELTRLGDEEYGAVSLAAFELPSDSITPQAGQSSSSLNFTGPRLRGSIEDERIREVARPLSVQAKMQIVQQLKLDLLPPMLLGITESYVISEAQLTESLFVVCRRVQIAYALADLRSSASSGIYNYDSLKFNIAHFFTPDMEYETPVEVAFGGLPGCHLNNPTDCVIYKDQLWIADGGTPQSKSAIRVWQIVR